VSKLVTAIGLMSGTSLDGIDVAFIKTDGENIVERGASMTFAYNDEQRRQLMEALGDARIIEQRDERPGNLASIEQELTDWHIYAVQHFLSENPAEVDVIGFHGQTVIHRPEKKLTVQLGLGEVLAQKLGIPVVYDMRASDVAVGGQGAPLVPVYHRALAAGIPDRPVVFVNIGGVSNITAIDSQGEMLAFDTGPGNALLDDWAGKHTGLARDVDGALAAQGMADKVAVEKFLAVPFFRAAPPKSLDRNSFAGISIEGLSAADGAATLVEVTTRAIARATDWLKEPPKTWVICGGGRHNPTIMASLEQKLPNVKPAEDFGFDGDAMEAEAWAYLAVRSLKGLPLTFPGTTKVSAAMTGGVSALLR
jgi:anhydro-N-acetylmuramic acid kinase